MSRCIEKLPHSCGSKDGLQVFQDSETDKYSGYCFACDTYVHDPYEDKEEGYKPESKKYSEKDVQAELKEIGDLKAVDLDDRKLEREYLEYFGVKVEVSEQDGFTPTMHFYPYTHGGKLVGYKARLVHNKQMWTVGNMREVDFFGWEKALTTGAKKLFITEGELDAVALFQALKKKAKGTNYEAYDPAVVSLPKGAAHAKQAIIANIDKMNAHFGEVILVFDTDAAGVKATEECVKAYPNAKSVDIPGKDANECVMNGRSTALCNAVLFKAVKPKNTQLVWGASLYEEGRQQAQWGYSWPWQGLTDLTRGIRLGETYYIGGGVKMGKSEVVNAIGAHMILEHGLKCFMVKPEEAKRKTYQMLCGKAVGRIFHDPKIPFDYDAYDEANAKIGNNVCILDLYQRLTWEHLKYSINGAVNEGCKIVFIDPITNLTNGISSGEANTILQDISQELAAMSKDMDIATFIFCHLKAPTNGEPHERGGKVQSHQFSGSRAMMRSCNYMVGIEGNKDPDLPVELRNIREIVLLEDREFGSVGKVRLYWDENTGLFNEIREE